MSRSKGAPHQRMPLTELAWHGVFRRCYPVVFRLFCSRIGAADAQAAAAEVFRRASAEAASIAGNRSDAHDAIAVVLRIARVLLIAEVAAREAEPAHPIGLMSRDYVEASVTTGLGALPVDERVALELRYLLGLTPDESALVLDQPQETVLATTRRALQHYAGADAGLTTPAAPSSSP